jgi:hypothetical protein
MDRLRKQLVGIWELEDNYSDVEDSEEDTIFD